MVKRPDAQKKKFCNPAKHTEFTSTTYLKQLSKCINEIGKK